MVYKVFKRVTKGFEEIFSKEKQTHEIQLKIGDSWIRITEQQLGSVFSPPHPPEIEIYVPEKQTTYGMDYNTFLDKITK